MKVAVKKLRRLELEDYPIALEYLEREIKIMRLLRNCEYVVHLHHCQVLKNKCCGALLCLYMQVQEKCCLW